MCGHNYLAIRTFYNTSNHIRKPQHIHIIKMTNRIINKYCSKSKIVCC